MPKAGLNIMIYMHACGPKLFGHCLEYLPFPRNLLSSMMDDWVHARVCVFVYLYLCICIRICVFVYLTVGHLGISFLTFLNQQLFRNIAYVWYSWHFNKAEFVNLYLCICICICLFVYLCI